MHRASAASRATGRFAVELGHQLIHRGAANQRMAVLPIGGDNRVLIRERRNGAGSHGLFTDIQMEKTVDLSHLVQFCGPFLEAADP